MGSGRPGHAGQNTSYTPDSGETAPAAIRLFCVSAPETIQRNWARGQTGPRHAENQFITIKREGHTAAL